MLRHASRPRNPVTTRDVIDLVALGFLWGASFLFMRIAGPEFGPLALVEVRVLIAAVVLAIVVPLNLLPYAGRGDKLPARFWAYFFCIGIAFMVVEIVLIQKYTLLIGASIYSIGTVLLTLLIASGLGARSACSGIQPMAFCRSNTRFW